MLVNLYKILGLCQMAVITVTLTCPPSSSTLQLIFQLLLSCFVGLGAQFFPVSCLEDDVAGRGDTLTSVRVEVVEARIFHTLQLVCDLTLAAHYLQLDLLRARTYLRQVPRDALRFRPMLMHDRYVCSVIDMVLQFPVTSQWEDLKMLLAIDTDCLSLYCGITYHVAADERSKLPPTAREDLEPAVLFVLDQVVQEQNVHAPPVVESAPD